MASILDRLGARLLQNRSFVRAPIWLYRHRLGWLLGTRILMLEHTGRTSGRPRYVCLEVVVSRPDPDVIVVVSGFGERAQWYRNLRAHSACKVSIGTARSVPAQARLMDAAESADALQAYQRAHPQAWRGLRTVIEEAVGSQITELPMVELRLDR